MEEYRAVRKSSGQVRAELSGDEITTRLHDLSWKSDVHELKDYQLANLARLLSVPNGANFSVPGAGKTTVTFAMHLLLAGAVDCLLVVAPRNAFSAWEEVIGECLRDDARDNLRTPLVQLVGGEARISELLAAGGQRFIISFDQLIRVEPLLKELLTRKRVHLVVDESHKMKDASGKRGRALLRLGHLAVRRDILTGTPMPQASTDLQSQFDFLWPGAGLGSRIARGEPPRSVIDGLFVRTTKEQLKLEPRTRVPIQVEISDAHLAFYSVIKDDVRARASELRRGASGVALKRARQMVVRLLQAAVNPELVAGHIADSVSPERDGLLRAVIREGPSARVRAAADLTRDLASQGKKVLIWTIFTPTLHRLIRMLQDLQPAVIYGMTGIGTEDDESSRQGQIRRFKSDPACKVMVANPAAAAEGMSLHLVCHDAIYVDRSYNATHFLQSVDRIHRLGLTPGTATNVYVLENKLPFGVGSIDVSVARRLARKIRGMEQLLGDPDLNALALDEEEMEGAIEDSISTEDIDDLIRVLEEGTRASDSDDIV
jgi:SNF2 family DNA or RNA helicase